MSNVEEQKLYSQRKTEITTTVSFVHTEEVRSKSSTEERESSATHICPNIYIHAF